MAALNGIQWDVALAPRESMLGALLADALRSEGVAFVPGAAFFFDGFGQNTIRLNFSLQSEPAIDEGLRRLGALIRRQPDVGATRIRGREAVA